MTMMTAATANNPRFAERMHKSLLSLTEPYQIKRQMAYMSDEDLAAMPEEVARSWQRILQGESQPQQTGQIPQQTGQIPISQAAPAATPTSAARSSGLEDGLYRFDPEVGLDNVSRFGHNVWEGVKGTAEGAYQLATSPIETAKGVADLASSAWAYADEDTRDSPEAAPARQIISGLKEGISISKIKFFSLTLKPRDCKILYCSLISISIPAKVLILFVSNKIGCFLCSCISEETNSLASPPQNSVII